MKFNKSVVQILWLRQNYTINTTLHHSATLQCFFFLPRQVNTLLVQFHCWPRTRNGTPAPCLVGSSENSVSGCADCRLGPFLRRQLLAHSLLHGVLQGWVPLAHLFLPHFPSSRQLSAAACWWSALRTDGPFSGDLPRLRGRVGECLLGNWRVGSPAHHRN